MEFEGIISQDPEMLKIFDLVRKMSKIDAPVLVQGQSGTGKELIARAIHAQSPRNKNSFVDINCAAVPETLLESELFGYNKGAFTGAASDHKGYFEQAHEGTLFLDEIGEVHPAVQVKLLRVLQEHRIRPLGGSNDVSVDIRIVSATNTDLLQAVRDRIFRQDLYFRLNAIVINLPLLRDRINDVPLLARHFLGIACNEMGLSNVDIDPEVLGKLMRYSWPGNVRELQNMIVAAVCSCFMADSSGPSDVRRVITLDDCPTLNEKVARSPRKTRLTDVPFYEARAQFEKDYIETLLKRFDHNISAASRAANISRKSLTTKAAKFGLIEPVRRAETLEPEPVMI
ncbi:MAG: sigma-54-dependent Fis family transcriptional regulator [Planctomycetes bacterium]|nr:sigma-54-dependent Fis family transcriptional regulator [Planctomycetota bacterium]